MRPNSDNEELAARLFESVLNGNEDQVRRLLRWGADPNHQVGDKVNGVLSNELRIKTAHQLAVNLKQENILQLFATRRRHLRFSLNGNKNAVCCKNRKQTRQNTNMASTSSTDTAQQHHVSPQAPTKIDLHPATAGYVYILNYNLFKNRTTHDATSSDQEAKELLDSFEKIGYSGILYPSLTESETKKALDTVKDLSNLKEGQFIVFIIRGYAPYQTSVFTSDCRLLQFNDIIEHITDPANSSVGHLRKFFFFYINRWLESVIIADDSSNSSTTSGKEYKPKENSTVGSLYFESNQSKWPKSCSSSPINPVSFTDAVFENIRSHRDTKDLVDLANKLGDAVRNIAV